MQTELLPVMPEFAGRLVLTTTLDPVPPLFRPVPGYFVLAQHEIAGLHREYELPRGSARPVFARLIALVQMHDDLDAMRAVERPARGPAEIQTRRSPRHQTEEPMNTGQELRLTVLDDQTITLPGARTLAADQTITIENKGPGVLTITGSPTDRLTAPRMSPEDCRRYHAMLASPTDRQMLGPYACELIQQALDYSRAP